MQPKLTSNPGFNYKCWWCQGPLTRHPLNHTPIFENTRNGHRVHKACLRAANEKPITAAPPEDMDQRTGLTPRRKEDQ